MRDFRVALRPGNPSRQSSHDCRGDESQFDLLSCPIFGLKTDQSDSPDAVFSVFCPCTTDNMALSKPIVSSPNLFLLGLTIRFCLALQMRFP